jgi:hypothetical protein
MPARKLKIEGEILFEKKNKGGLPKIGNFKEWVC